MNLRILLASSMVALAATSVVKADYDVSPSLNGSQLFTNAYDDGTGSFISHVRVFPYDFDVSGPGMISFTEDPGFHPRPGSNLGGDSLSVGAVTGLSYWNGIGSPSFGAVPNGETLNLAFGSFNITIGTTAPSATLSLDPPPDPQGEFDHHLGSTLTGPGATEPTDGIYLVGLQLISPGLTNSQPFYIIYNSTDDDDLADEAAEFVRDTDAPGSTLTPEPAALSCLLAPLALFVRRRRV